MSKSKALKNFFLESQIITLLKDLFENLKISKYFPCFFAPHVHLAIFAFRVSTLFTHTNTHAWIYMDIWALIWLWNLYFCIMMLSSSTSFLVVYIYIYIQVVDDSLHYSVLFASFSYNHFGVIFIDNPNK